MLPSAPELGCGCPGAALPSSPAWDIRGRALHDAVVRFPVGNGRLPGIMVCGVEVPGVWLLWLTELWGASGAGPWVSASLMDLWCSAWGTEALSGATGGSTQRSKSIKLTGCSRAPAVCAGDATDRGPIEEPTTGARPTEGDGALPTERHS